MTIGAGGNVEVELAWTLADPNDTGRFLSAERVGAFRASGKARPLQVEDRYVDTVDAALARAGFAARLRRARSGSVLTVKSRASSGGPLQRRTELEGPADISLDVESWPPSIARSLVLELCGDAPLREIVTIRQVRRKRDLECRRARAELTVDEVEIVSGGSVVSRFSELEVELLEGDEEPLRELEQAWAGDTGLVPSGRSKFERALEAIGLIGPVRTTGHRLIAPALEELLRRAVPDARAEDPEPRPADPGARAGDPEPRPADPEPRAGDPEPRPADPEARAERTDPDGQPQPKEAAAAAAAPPADPRPAPKGPGVRSEDTFAEAGRKVLAFHYGRLLDREPGVREGKEPGELKSMRVATRRMRAAWRVFGEAFRRSKTRKLRSHLRDVAQRLGAVRDLDVLIDGLEAYRDTLPSKRRRSLEPLVRAWRADRASERDALVDLLDSDEYRELVEEYGEFLDADPAAVARAGDNVVEPSLVRETAASRIWAAEEHVRAFEPLVETADVPTLHRLRIATKRLRYTVEFFREALGPEAGSLVERCVAVQDHLGALNDAHVTAGLVTDFLARHREELAPSEAEEIERYLASRDAEVVRLRGEFTGPWAGLVAAEFRHGLGRAVAEL